MMFEFNPDMVMADDDEADVDMTLYKREDLDEEVSSLFFLFFQKIVCFTSYFVFCTAVLPHSPEVD